jgi:hypothetical protein
MAEIMAADITPTQRAGIELCKNAKNSVNIYYSYNGDNNINNCLEIVLNSYTAFRVYPTKVQSVDKFLATTIELNGTNWQTTLNGKTHTSDIQTASQITDFATALINRGYPVDSI